VDPRTPLSVRLKILGAVVVSVVTLSIVIFAISREVLFESYLEIEREEVAKDVGRATDAIQEFSRQQLIKLSDWAAWDEAYEYARDRDPAWAAETIYPTGLANLDINSMLFTDTEGEVVLLLAVDIEERVEVPADDLRAYFEAHPELTRFETLDAKMQGIAMLPQGPLIVVSLPLKTSEGLGPSTGALTFSRYLDERKIAELSDITHLSISVYPYGGENPEEIRQAEAELRTGVEYVVTPLSRETIAGYTLLKGLYGEPILVLKVETARPIYAQGFLSFYVFMAISAVALILFGVGILWLLDVLVISRFVRLTKEVENINTAQSLSVRVQGGVQDEIGKLAGKINQMLTWLSVSRNEITAGKERAEEMVRIRTQELRDEKARLLASINSLSFGFVIASPRNDVIVHNPALTRILNLSAAPVSVADIARVIPAVDVTALGQASISGKTASEKDNVAYGTKILKIVSVPILPDTGDVIGYVLIVEDITEAKIAERSREEFFTIASHELRTPLTAIRWNTELLLKTYKDQLPTSEARTMLEDIGSSSERLISIVNDFLEASSFEQGKIEMGHAAFDIRTPINEALRDLGGLATQKGLSLTFVEPSEPIQVTGDRVRIEQVLTNLVGNAIKFTETGGITVMLVVEDRMVRVRVTDTGLGVAERNQSLLFRKFQQAGDDLLSRHGSESTGLGLYISKLIVVAMGGEIGLEASEPGKGSTFYFTIPKA